LGNRNKQSTNKQHNQIITSYVKVLICYVSIGSTKTVDPGVNDVSDDDMKTKRDTGLISIVVYR